MRLFELSLYGGSAVAAESGGTTACDGGDDVGLRVDAADHMILHLDKIHIPRPVEANFIRLVQRGLSREPAVAGIALLAVPRHRGYYMGLQVQPANAMVSDLAKVERTVRSDCQPVRIVDQGV